jgi:hypothetical protein
MGAGTGSPASALVSKRILLATSPSAALRHKQTVGFPNSSRQPLLKSRDALACTIINHRRLNITWPQQFPNAAFHKNLYGFIEDLQDDLDLWIQNGQRGQAYLGTVLLIVC